MCIVHVKLGFYEKATKIGRNLSLIFFIFEAINLCQNLIDMHLTFEKIQLDELDFLLHV